MNARTLWTWALRPIPSPAVDGSRVEALLARVRIAPADLGALGYWTAWLLIAWCVQPYGHARVNGWWLLLVLLASTAGFVRPLHDVSARLRPLTAAAALVFACWVAYHTIEWIWLVVAASPLGAPDTVLRRLTGSVRLLASGMIAAAIVPLLFRRPFDASLPVASAAAVFMAVAVDLVEFLSDVSFWTERPARLVLRLSMAVTSVAAAYVVGRWFYRRQFEHPISEHAAHCADVWHGRRRRLWTVAIAFPVAIAAYWWMLFGDFDLYPLHEHGYEVPSLAMALLGIAGGTLVVLTTGMAWRALAAATLSNDLRVVGQGVVTVAAGITGVVLVFAGGPHAGAVMLDALERHTGQPYRATVQGKRLHLDGSIHYGVAYTVTELLDAHPEVSTLVLESPGGLGHEALLLGDEVQRRELTTVVADDCESACSLIFLAGTTRVLEKDGRLGFHSSASFLPLESDDGNAEYIAALVEWGVPAAFARRAMSVDHEDMWYPTRAELESAGLISPESAARVIESQRPRQP